MSWCTDNVPWQRYEGGFDDLTHEPAGLKTSRLAEGDKKSFKLQKLTFRNCRRLCEKEVDMCSKEIRYNVRMVMKGTLLAFVRVSGWILLTYLLTY